MVLTYRDPTKMGTKKYSSCLRNLQQQGYSGSNKNVKTKDLNLVHEWKTQAKVTTKGTNRMLILVKYIIDIC